MSKAYYNEFDPFAAQWLRKLIARGLIAPGDVDERSIVEVQPDDLRGYDQCHFFAGIGGWSYALRLAGWADDRPVWTGSCPCQPFSAAGQKRGSDDERHLWPAFFRLIRECRPSTIFGEQVAGAAGLAWLDHVHADLESAGYAVAAADLPAGSVGAPHRRQRLWFVAQSDEEQWRLRRATPESAGGPQPELAGSGVTGRVAHAGRAGRQQNTRSAFENEETHGRAGWDMGESHGDYFVASDGTNSVLAHVNATGFGPQRRVELLAGKREAFWNDTNRCGATRGVGAPDGARLERRRDDVGEHAGQLFVGAASPWPDLAWLACSDGKARPTESSIQRLADGLSDSLGYVRDGDRRILSPLIFETKNRTQRLRGYGNAIVPQLAAEFIAAYCECIADG